MEVVNELLVAFWIMTSSTLVFSFFVVFWAVTVRILAAWVLWRQLWLFLVSLNVTLVESILLIDLRWFFWSEILELVLSTVIICSLTLHTYPLPIACSLLRQTQSTLTVCYLPYLLFNCWTRPFWNYIGDTFHAGGERCRVSNYRVYQFVCALILVSEGFSDLSGSSPHFKPRPEHVLLQESG